MSIFIWVQWIFKNFHFCCTRSTMDIYVKGGMQLAIRQDGEGLNLKGRVNSCKRKSCMKILSVCITHF